MVQCSKCNEYKSRELISDGICNSCEQVRPDVYRRLQARIVELENELKHHKKAAEAGGRMLQMMLGYRFNTDSLH